MRIVRSVLPVGFMLAVPLALFFGLDVPFTRENLVVGLALASVPAVLFTLHLSEPMQRGPQISVASEANACAAACRSSSRGDPLPDGAERLGILGIARRAISERTSHWAISADRLGTDVLVVDPARMFAIISQIAGFIERAAPGTARTVELLSPKVDARAHPELVLIHMRFSVDGGGMIPPMRDRLTEFLNSGEHADQFPELAIAHSFLHRCSGQLGCEHFDTGTLLWVSIALPRVVRAVNPAFRTDHITEFGYHLRRLVFPNASGAALLSARLSELTPHGKPV